MRIWKSSIIRVTVSAVFLTAGALWIAGLRAKVPDSPSPPDAGPPATGSAANAAVPPHYAGRKTCAECHAKEAAAWSGSDHDKAMQPAADSTVLGNFNGDTLVSHGKVSRFYKKDGAFFAHTSGPGGVAGEFRIRYAFGVRPLQQYLIGFPGGRMQSLPLAWDTEKRRWFDLQAETNPAPDDWLHWTRDGQNWNGMCADCHSTGLHRGYDAATGTFATTWEEANVGCEACHGPGSEHVDFSRRNPILKSLSIFAGLAGLAGFFGLSGFANHGREDHFGLKQDHLGRKADAEVMVCAQCHARRSALRADFSHAKEFLDAFTPELIRPEFYHPDGQIAEEDYEYGSFLQSRMYHQGVRCSDCHDPHTLKLRAQGNALCVRCHEAARFDTPTHHGHASGSSGSRCAECHMPAKLYMQVDLRRDHSLRVPRPDLSVKYGTPNACTGCHADKNPAWAAAWIAKRFGPVRKAHFSDLLVPGLLRSEADAAVDADEGAAADSALTRLAENPQYPGIARASAVAALAEFMGRLAPSVLIGRARDPDPLVRWAAATGLEKLPGDERVSVLLPLLNDSLRAVRVAAAQALVEDAALLPDSSRAAYNRALGEYREALDANAYFPGGRFNIGLFQEKSGNADSAIAAYSAALALDNRFVPARINLAQLYARTGRIAEAASQFREALRLNPEYPETRLLLESLLSGAGFPKSPKY